MENEEREVNGTIPVLVRFEMTFKRDTLLTSITPVQDVRGEEVEIGESLGWFAKASSMSIDLDEDDLHVVFENVDPEWQVGFKEWSRKAANEWGVIEPDDDDDDEEEW